MANAVMVLYFVIIAGARDYSLTGLFPAKIASKSPSFSSVVYNEAMLFAIREVNRHVLSNLTQLRHHVYDSYGETQTKTIVEIFVNTIARMSKEDLSPHCSCSGNGSANQMLGFVGPGYSSSSVLLHRLMQIRPVPMISYTATSSQLSDSATFPYFLRTIPSDSIIAEVVVDVLLQFHWRFVSIIASDNSFGRSGRRDLLALLAKHDICVDVDELFQVPYSEENIKIIMRRFRKDVEDHSANAVILYAVSKPTQMILDMAYRYRLFNYTWILVDTSRLSHWFKSIHKDVVTGIIALTHDAGKYSSFEEHLEKIFQNKTSPGSWFAKLLEYKNHNSLREKFQTILPFSGYVRDAVYAYANALKAYLNGENSTDIDIPLFLNKYLKKSVLWRDNMARRQFDEKGDAGTSEFQLLNIQSNNTDVWIENVGHWNTRGRLTINKPIMWADSTFVTPHSLCSKKCSPGTYGFVNLGNKCCWKCVPCPLGFAKLIVGHEECVECIDGVSNHNRTRCISITNVDIINHTRYLYTMCSLLLIGVALCFCCLFLLYKFQDCPMVQASNYRLSAYQLLIHILFYASLGLITARATFQTCSALIVLFTYQESTIAAILLSKLHQLLRFVRIRENITSRDVLVTRNIGLLFIIIVLIGQSLFVSLLFAFEKVYAEEVMLSETTRAVFCQFNVFFIQNCCYTIILSFAGIILVFRLRNLQSKFNEVKVIFYSIVMKLLMAFLYILIVFSFDTGFSKPFLVFFAMYVSNTAIVMLMYGRKLSKILQNNSNIDQDLNLIPYPKENPTSRNKVCAIGRD